MDFNKFSISFKEAFPDVITQMRGTKMTMVSKENSVEGFFTFRTKIFWYCVYMLNGPIMTIRTAENYEDLSGGINHHIRIGDFSTLKNQIVKTIQSSLYIHF